MSHDLLPLTVGALGFCGIGFLLLRRSRISRLERVALAFALGIASAVPVVVMISRFRIPFSLLTVLLVATSVLAMIATARDWNVHKKLESPLSVVFWLSGAISIWKMAKFPLWTWDYFAIWGVKARRLISAGSLDFSFLFNPVLAASNPGYPVGLPVAYRLMFLGRDLTPLRSKLEHILVSIAVLLVARATLRLVTDAHFANLWAAYLAMSVLFWDTTLVGIAEMPLALFSSAAVFLVLAGETPAAASGVCIGFLPWIKDEGMILCVSLLVVAVIMKRARVVTAVTALLVASSAAIYQALALPHGLTFWAGDWIARLIQRLHDPALVLAPVAGDLLAWSWLGLWPLFAAALIVAIVRRSTRAFLLLSIVVVQLAAYVAIYFVSYIEPGQHIASSFHRIAAACAPIAIVGIAAAFDGASQRSSQLRPDSNALAAC